ncbi:MAG: preprotein translocase subunit SecA [Deltaproteobacteria bacterium]|nr:preprotein translocase subunit SecA [Deltaproteobacteria bacterium]
MAEFVGRKVFGSKNERALKRIRPMVFRVNELEPRIRALTDVQLKAKTAELRQRFANAKSERLAGVDEKADLARIIRTEAEILDELLPEAFAVVREASVRVLGMRHFDVQIIGGVVLHEGRIAEMKTGEGKTLVATLSVYLNALAGRGVHVVTVNDYLATRDTEWMGQIYRWLGMTVGTIVHGLTDTQRQDAYNSDITYGYNSEFGFDYLRDNMKFRLRDYCQRELHYAIVDEVDSILVDEARTPLIISGPAEEATDKYYKCNAIIPKLRRDRDYTVEEKSRTAVLTEDGVSRVEQLLGVDNLYHPSNIEMLHHVNQALRAHTLFKREVDYIVTETGKVQIVDEFTGRVLEGRRWSDGLHQAVEAKEGVPIENENQTLATITYQNYFRMYHKLAGMTGTAETEREEFQKIYNLEVNVIPTNKPNRRTDFDDVIYRTEEEKFGAVVDEIRGLNEKGQPVLVGTISIEKSEEIARRLRKAGLKHNVLNAKHHKKEAEIVAQAGRYGGITISTNMAGRGTDIVLGGNPDFLARLHADPQAERDRYLEALRRFQETCAEEREKVLEAGGLHILGTERHEARRIDNQLRGRSARQGDPGSSRFYLSLEDDLLRIFGADRLKGLMERLGMEEGVPIEHKWVSRSISSAQKRVEGQNFEIRKSLLEYDDVMNQQRKAIYDLRRRVLGGENMRDQILDLIEDLLIEELDMTCSEEIVPEDWDVKGIEDRIYGIFGQRVELADIERNREAIGQRLWGEIESIYKSKEEQVGAENMRRVEQYFYLQEIDGQWKDHLLAMDHLRSAVGLRGYAQKDPKQEYKREGYDLFQAMNLRIKTEVAKKLMQVQLESDDAGEQLMRQRMARRRSMHYGAPDAASGSGGKVQTIKRDGRKVGRNDPCPCGSGKKYKHCCLRKQTHA